MAKDEHKLPDSGFIGQLSGKDRKRLATFGTYETVLPGKHIVEQGKTHHSLFVIVKGKLKVYCHAHGDIVKLAKLGKGDTVGEMGMIRRGDHPSSASAIAGKSGALVWVLKRKQFEAILAHDPELGCHFLRCLANELCSRLRKYNEHLLRREIDTRDKFLEMDY